MLVRPYEWFANIHGASDCNFAETVLFQQPPFITTPSGCACHPKGRHQNCRLTYRLNRRLYSASTSGEWISAVRPLLCYNPVLVNITSSGNLQCKVLSALTFATAPN